MTHQEEIEAYPCSHCGKGEYYTKSDLHTHTLRILEGVEGMMKREFELNLIECECGECAGTGEGNDNPNSDHGETYPCYACRGTGRFKGYRKSTVTDVLTHIDSMKNEVMNKTQ